jgi:predicted MPP superfamily phosphohydrolase
MMPEPVAVTRYRVGSERGAPAPSMTVAVLADFHAAWPWMSRHRIARIVARTNALGCDLVCLLGDYAGHVIGGRDLPSGTVAAELANLRAPLGVHAVCGNHDWYDDPDARDHAAMPTIWHRALAEAGMSVHSNGSLRLEVGGTPFNLVGLESQQAFKKRRPRPETGPDDVARALTGLDPGLFTLLLAHEPDVFPDLPGWIDLTLSGHTHGGQIAPFGRPLVVPSRHGTRYAHGRFAEGTRQLLVSRGLGCTTIPFRIGAPPEIVVVEIA